MRENKVIWRKLDNSAKLFPSISNKKFSTVFRISVILNKDIEPEILKLSTNQALKKFASFKVRLRKGLFWYYLEENPKKIVIEEEHDYPCRSINMSNNNDYLFKITYFKNKINIDVFHALTDGTSASIFFREIIYNYIENSNSNKFIKKDRNNDIVTNNTEDSYLKNYNKNLGKRSRSKKAHLLKGKKLPLSAIGTIHGCINLQKLKEVCKSKEMTITRIFNCGFNKSNI